VVLAGPPNAGKSSLLNAIAGHDRAIVTDVPGTTRDHIEVPLALSGVPIRLTDTAGLRESAELIERIGVDRANALIDLADILVWLGEAHAAPAHPHLLRVHSRSDMAGRGRAPKGSIPVSSKTGSGLAELNAAIVFEAKSLLPVEGQLALNRRQAKCVGDARDSLQAAERAPELVILAESLRGARIAFDRLTGRAGVEDLLDSLFGRFCLGK
jgi:tRNA modification GTPase